MSAVPKSLTGPGTMPSFGSAVPSKLMSGVGTSMAPSITTPASYKTQFMGYACEWSPFEANKLAVATAQHFGIVGNGRQHIINVDLGSPVPFRDLGVYHTRDGVFDCSWSELNENHLVSACGDGRLRLWDLKAPTNPLRAYEGHTSEIYSVDWNLVSKRHFISGSWDKTARLWDPVSSKCLGVYTPHRGLIYNVSWAPRDDNVFASVSEDQHFAINDVRSAAGGGPLLSVKAHDHEVLTCDFNKYDRNVLATGSCDKRIKIWDLRHLSKELCQLNAHRYAVRRLRFSPHSATQLMSVSYDMSTVLWDYAQSPNPIVAQFKHHREFAVGLAFNLFHKGLVATSGWDLNVSVYNIDSWKPPMAATMHDPMKAFKVSGT